MEKSIKEMNYGSRTVIGDHADRPFPSDISGAVLQINEGFCTDMVFHCQHEKIIYLLSGKIKINVVESGKMCSEDISVGEEFLVSPGTIHQISAIEKSVVIEFVDDCGYDCDIHCVSKGCSVKWPS